MGGGGVAAYRCGYLHASAVVRASSSLHKSRNGGKLATHFLHHSQGSLAHRLHGHGTEPVGQHGSNEQAREHLQHRRASATHKTCMNGCEHDALVEHTMGVSTSHELAMPYETGGGTL